MSDKSAEDVPAELPVSEVPDAPSEDLSDGVVDNPYDVVDPYMLDQQDAADTDPGDENDSEGDPAEADVPEEDDVPVPAAKRPKKDASDEPQFGGEELDLSDYLDDALASATIPEIRALKQQLAQLEEMVRVAGIRAPMDAAISKVGEQFPDTFGTGSPTVEQSEARNRLSEAADLVIQTYRKRGKQPPTHEAALKVAMGVEFPELARKAEQLASRSARREGQRIARPVARESDLSPEDRATRAVRQKWVEAMSGDTDKLI
jgi:hypothetical protein